MKGILEASTGERKTIGIILLGWLILNLLQAAFTGLIHDEAYYWLYAKDLDWGYFDHPPGIAVFIKLGGLIFNGELGVRFLVVLAFPLSLFLMWKTTRPYTNDYRLFFLIAFSVILVHIGGFLAVPDTPLIFFAALFFFFYKKYLENDTLLNATIIGVLCAALLYSKYHGVLIIFFTLLSNLKLLGRKSFWYAAILATVLFLPHVYWQYLNDYPSLKYHLAGRSKEAYDIEFTVSYILGQLLITGPLVGFFLFWACFKQEAEDKFMRCLKFCFWGIMFFFFVSSFKGRVEANWTAVAFLPMISLSAIYASSSPKFYTIIRKLAIPSIVLILLFRLFLPMDFIPAHFGFKTDVHNWDKWAKQLQEKADGAPVIFMSSYQKASKYSFYTGEASYSMNNVYYRRNQFNLWTDKEMQFQGKKVLFVPVYNPSYTEEFKTATETEYVGFIDPYYSYDYLRVETGLKSIKMKAGEGMKVKATVKNPSKYTANLWPDENVRVNLNYTIEKNNKVVLSKTSDPVKQAVLLPGEEFEQEITIIAPNEAGSYSIIITLQNGVLLAGFNGDYIPLTVE